LLNNACKTTLEEAVAIPMGAEMAHVSELDIFRVPLGNQQVELQQIDHAEGGMSLLRIRIREGRRFTIFDIDPATARRWGEGMLRWADAQKRAGE
jgi:hypothetical protein